MATTQSNARAQANGAASAGIGAARDAAERVGSQVGQQAERLGAYARDIYESIPGGSVTEKLAKSVRERPLTALAITAAITLIGTHLLSGGRK